MSPPRLTQRGSSQRLPVILPKLGSQETDHPRKVKAALATFGTQLKRPMRVRT